MKPTAQTKPLMSLKRLSDHTLAMMMNGEFKGVISFVDKIDTNMFTILTGTMITEVGKQGEEEETDIQPEIRNTPLTS